MIYKNNKFWIQKSSRDWLLPQKVKKQGVASILKLEFIITMTIDL